jgi:hypothetical protein
MHSSHLSLPVVTLDKEIENGKIQQQRRSARRLVSDFSAG